jgi:nucleotide-binding universal stress UspA family protein
MPGIIVGIDGSSHSRRALEWAVREAAVRQVPLTVITIHQVASSAWTGQGIMYAQDEELATQARKSAQEETDDVLEQAGDKRPPQVTVKAVSGLPAEQLLAAAAAEGADMLVIGSRGSGGFSRLLLGSVSSQVTHHATCPVVIIPGADRHR